MTLSTEGKAGKMAWKDLGHVYALQGPDNITSLVRVSADGKLVCDCPWRPPEGGTDKCIHVQLIRRLRSELQRQPTVTPLVIAEERFDGVRVVAEQLPDKTTSVTVTVGDAMCVVRPDPRPAARPAAG